MRKKSVRTGWMLIIAFSVLICGSTGIFINPGHAEDKKTEQKQDNTYDQIKLLLDILTFTKDNYVEDVDTQKLIYSAAAGMLRPLDPFSQFMEPESYKEMKVETEGKYGGLGIRISIRDSWLIVITPLPGTPAYRAGIVPEDKIIKIENESTYGITIEEAVNKLRGDPGTNVKITIAREGAKEPVEFTLTREIIKIETLSSKMVTPEIGYIHLYEFNANAEVDTRKAINDLKAQGMKSLVFDLRYNPGGLLNIAIDVVKLFLGDKKLIVYTQGRVQQKKEYFADQTAVFPDLPVIVLINNGSASASEILSGALQDHKRALVVGMKSFGKASVQTVIPMQNGAGLRLTTAKYYTPSGRLIQRDEKDKQKGGIDPDIKIEVKPEIEAKVRQQEEKIYPPGKEPVSTQKDQVEDVTLQRAVEFLKVRSIFK